MERKTCLQRVWLWMAFAALAFLWLLPGKVWASTGIASNMLEKVKPYYYYRYSEGTVEMGGKQYDDALCFDTYNSIQAEACFNLEGKYTSMTFVAGHENGTQDRTVTIYCDDVEAWSETIASDDLPHSGSVSLAGVKKLRIVVSASGASFKTALGQINLVGGPTREEKLTPITSNFTTNLGDPYNSKRFARNDDENGVLIGDQCYLNVIGFDSYNNVEASASYNLEGYYSSMTFYVGHETGSSAQSRTVSIYGDGTRLYYETIEAGDLPHYGSVDLTGVHQLKFVVGGSSGSFETYICGIQMVSDGQVRSIQLDQNAMSLSTANPSAYLKATIVPADAADQTVTWSSSDTSVATVSTTGLVQGVAGGTAEITATAANGASASCTVTVDMPKSIGTATVTLDNTSFVYNGSEQKPSVKVSLNGSELSSNNYTTAYSDNINAGTAKVTVTGKGDYTGTASATFTITKAEPTLSYAKSAVAKTTADAAFTNPLTSTTDGSISYSSDNTAVATVSASGEVTILSAGKAVISAKAAEGTNYKASGTVSYTLTVTKADNDTSGTSDNTSGTAADNTTGTTANDASESTGVPQKGKTYTVGTMKYKVTNAATNGSGTVMLTGSTKSASALSGTVKVPDVVKIGGYSYRVTAIGTKAFRNYKKITALKIGKNVKKIGTSAFQNCKKLKKITVSSKVLTSVGKNSIKGIYAKAKIKVPASRLTKYKKLFSKKAGYTKKMKISK